MQNATGERSAMAWERRESVQIYIILRREQRRENRGERKERWERREKNKLTREERENRIKKQ